MTRVPFIAVAGVAVSIVALQAVSASAQEPRPSEPAPAQNQNAQGQRPAQESPPRVAGEDAPQALELLALILGRGARQLEPAELAGMAAGSNPAVLTSSRRIH